MPIRKAVNRLPPLPFGSRTSTFDYSAYDISERLKTLINGLKEYESLNNSEGFLGQSSLININGLELSASATTPIQFKVEESNSTILLIPFAGEGAVRVDGRVLNYRAGETATFLANGTLSGESTTHSLIKVKIDTNRLHLTACSMLGLSPHSPLTLNLRASYEVKLNVGSVSFETLFRQYANLVDQYSLQPHLLNQLNIDDSIYRLIVMILQPSLHLGNTLLHSSNQYDRRLLDRTCQYIQTHLHQPITITMLERISCMSTRKLQYTFQDRFRCTPMEWLRSERLKHANELIVNAQPSTTLASIALLCGFNKSSTFAQYYKNQFGELPSSTLSRYLGN